MKIPSSDLFSFMAAADDEIAREYTRTRRRAREDPGTAGDQGEENWAEILREWLPPTYHVVTKGRILGYQGRPSDQVDVLVLHPTYPRGLQHKKLYLAGGVAAAFECKLTLKREHIFRAVQNAATIRRLLKPRLGTPYKELYSPLVYGLLAHSHVWKGKKSLPIANINQHLWDSDQQFTKHPREVLDLLCVADLATWIGSTHALMCLDGDNVLPPEILSSYMHHVPPNNIEPKSGYVAQPFDFRPLGKMISFLLQRLAWEDPAVRPIAEYFEQSGVGGAGGAGRARMWQTSLYLDRVRQQLEPDMWKSLASGNWNEWSVVLM